MQSAIYSLVGMYMDRPLAQAQLEKTTLCMLEGLTYDLKN